MAPDLSWTTPACFRYSVGGKEVTHCAAVDQWTRRIALPDAPSCPAWLVGNAGGVGHYVTRYWPPQLARIAEQVRDIPSFEMQALVNDTLLLAQGDLLPMAAALRVAEAAFRHPAPMVELAAVRLLEGLPDDWLKPAERAQKARIVATRVVPRARELGWTPRGRDSDDVKTLRASLLRFAAERPEGAALRPEARRLAGRWMADEASIDATMAPSVLDVAGRFADAVTFDRMLDTAIRNQMQRDRAMVLAAMVRARAPALRDRALAAALALRDGKPLLDARSTFTLLNKALWDDENRPAAFAYLLRNFAALEAKMPKDRPAALLVPLGRLCTPAERARLAAAYADRAPRYMTGELRYAQALESIDLCINARRR
jgi:alanyl aminopeptidase